jgi:hypothetical protein
MVAAEGLVDARTGINTPFLLRGLIRRSCHPGEWIEHMVKVQDHERV